MRTVGGRLGQERLDVGSRLLPAPRASTWLSGHLVIHGFFCWLSVCINVCLTLAQIEYELENGF